MKVQWVLYNISLPSSFVVTLIYWGALYGLYSPEIDFVNVGYHALNAVFMIIEQYLAAIPTRLLHFYQPIAYAAIYTIFTGILYVVSGIVVYPLVLDWTTPGVTLGVIGGLIIFYLVAQFVLFLIHRSLVNCLKSRDHGKHL